MTRRVIISGGGTGGHVYPALAIADAIEGLAEVVYFGDPRRLEGRVVPERGYQFVGVPAPLTPSGVLGMPLFVGRLLVAVARAFRRVRSLRPDLVIGVGGFVSVPALIAGKILRIPLIVHEANVRPGKANRLMNRLGVRVMATFEGTAEFVAPEKFVLTGLPVRPEIGAVDPARARAMLRVPPGVPTCLVVGGSNGAAAINAAAATIAQGLDRVPQLHLLQISGRRYFDDVARHRETLPEHIRARYMLVAYADEIAAFYAAADVVVSRSGSSTVNELLCAGRAAVLIPSPNVTEDHQTANARYVEAQGAAIVVPEESAAAVPDLVVRLLGDPVQRGRMSAAAGGSCRGFRARDEIRTFVAGCLQLREPRRHRPAHAARSKRQAPSRVREPR
jgi:UDP-N-acetylglucosamine--N-acetylmuramyl-(pentapeptide) pyrophosphoryl-undecaprenol N-acetylglucosamine transferase